MEQNVKLVKAELDNTQSSSSALQTAPQDGSVFLQFIIRDHDLPACTFEWHLWAFQRGTGFIGGGMFSTCQAGRKIAHTPYLRLFQSSFNIEDFF